MADQGSAHLWFFKDGKRYRVAQADIIYLEADGYSTIAYCLGKQKDTIEVYSSGYNLGSYEGYLNDGFFRIHRKYWVNLHFFQSILRNMLELSVSTLQPLPVSRRKRPLLLQKLLK